MRTHLLERRKREEWVGELGNVAHHKQRLTHKTMNLTRGTRMLLKAG